MNEIDYIVKMLKKYFSYDNKEYLEYEKLIVFEHKKRFEMFLREIPFPPIQIDFQLSSICDVNCRWCVGKNIMATNSFKQLKNKLSIELVQKIVKDIINLSDYDMHVETVMFSGLTGEPLLKKDLLFCASKLLQEHGIEVCLFTNGVLMTQESWKQLVNFEAVQVSLDGGTKSWKNIKNPQRSNCNYKMVINNIEGLVKYKKKNHGNAEINIGYTITNDNYLELESVVKHLVNIGVNSICIKKDITNKELTFYNVDVENMIKKCVSKYDNVTGTRVLFMHEDSSEKVSKWSCKEGCYYRYFFATIGSDGYVYPCDYQTMEGCPRISNLRKDELSISLNKKNVLWDSLVVKSHFNNICPPFAEKINPFMEEVIKLRDEYGVDNVLIAINLIQKHMEGNGEKL